MKSLRCAAGFHNDQTDAFGGYSPTCLRCGRPSIDGATPTFRGSLMSVFGVIMIFLGMAASRGMTDMITAIALGALLFVLGLGVIWNRRP